MDRESLGARNPRYLSALFALYLFIPAISYTAIRAGKLPHTSAGFLA